LKYALSCTELTVRRGLNSAVIGDLLYGKPTGASVKGRVTPLDRSEVAGRLQINNNTHEQKNPQHFN